MARKASKSSGKSPSKTKKKPKDSPGLFARLRDAWDTSLAGLAHLMDHAGRIGAVTLIAATLILWILGSDKLQARVAEIRATEPTVEIVLPRWADPAKSTVEPFIEETMREFESFARDRAGTDPFDHEALQNIQTALADTGWFYSGPTVRRTPGNVIRISGDWRSPAAIVEHLGQRHLVGLDAIHMRLPIAVAPPLEYLTIANPYAGPPPFGELWTGGDVEDALTLLSYLADHARSGSSFRTQDLEQIAGVDLRGYVEAGARSIRLKTQRGATLVWGSVPRSEGPLPGEIDYRTRLERVAMIVSGPVRGEDRPGPPLIINREAMVIDQVPSGGV